MDSPKQHVVGVKRAILHGYDTLHRFGRQRQNGQLAEALLRAEGAIYREPFIESFWKGKPEIVPVLEGVAAGGEGAGNQGGGGAGNAAGGKRVYAKPPDAELKKKLTANALTIYDELVAKRPNDPTFRYHRGLALLQRGESVKAKQDFETALRNKPNPSEEAKIKELLQKLS